MNFKVLIGFLCFGIISCNNPQKSSETSSKEVEISVSDSIAQPSIADQIANAAGIEHWNSVSEIAFTFNVDRDKNHTERSWIWNPKTADVKMITSKDTLAYNRNNLDSISKNADKGFINDKFWLLAPFQPAWDKGVSISEEYKVMAPISKDTLNKMTVVYSDDGGYTPGDAYDYFYDENYIIREWNYRKGNSDAPTLTNTWEDYKNFEGLKISTNHKDASSSFRLYFTNISVKSDK